MKQQTTLQAAVVGLLAALAFYVALRLSRAPPPAHMLR